MCLVLVICAYYGFFFCLFLLFFWMILCRSIFRLKLILHSCCFLCCFVDMFCRLQCFFVLLSFVVSMGMRFKIPQLFTALTQNNRCSSLSILCNDLTHWTKLGAQGVLVSPMSLMLSISEFVVEVVFAVPALKQNVFFRFHNNLLMIIGWYSLQDRLFVEKDCHNCFFFLRKWRRFLEHIFGYFSLHLLIIAPTEDQHACLTAFSQGYVGIWYLFSCIFTNILVPSFYIVPQLEFLCFSYFRADSKKGQCPVSVLDLELIYSAVQNFDPIKLPNLKTTNHYFVNWTIFMPSSICYQYRMISGSIVEVSCELTWKDRN